MIGRILLAYDGSSSAKSALIASCNLANSCDAELLGVFVEDERRFSRTTTTDRILGGLGMYPIEPRLHKPKEMIDELEKCDEDAERCSKEFYEGCTAHNVEGNFISSFGVAEDSLASLSRTVDMVVAGNSGLHSGLSAKEDGHTIDALLSKTIVPVLIVPENINLDGAILVAYDASPASDRVLRIAAEIATLRKLIDMHLLTVDADKENARRVQDIAVNYLEGCGFVVHTHLVEGKIPDSIADCAAKINPSFIAMGAQRSGTLSEKIFGSTTGAVLDAQPCAVLCIR